MKKEKSRKKILHLIWIIPLLIIFLAIITPDQPIKEMYDENTILNIFPTREGGLPTEIEIRNNVEELESKEGFNSTFQQVYSATVYGGYESIILQISLANDEELAQNYYENKITETKNKGGYTEIKYPPRNCYGYRKDSGLYERIIYYCYGSNVFIELTHQAQFGMFGEEFSKKIIKLVSNDIN
jgi:hypothetical protein